VRREPTAFAREHYDRVSGRYDRLIRVPERLLFGDGRPWAAGQAHGDVLEIAIGTGRNLPHYPADARLTGVDLSPGMLAIARRRADETMADVRAFRVADAQQLPFADASFDAVVATLAFCSIPDDTAAMTEAARVLRPGGTLILLEHVRSPVLVVRVAQRLLAPLAHRVEGDHLLRDPHRCVEAAGLQIALLERSKLGIVMRLTAHKPTT